MKNLILVVFSFIFLSSGFGIDNDFVSIDNYDDQIGTSSELGRDLAGLNLIPDPNAMYGERNKVWCPVQQKMVEVVTKDTFPSTNLSEYVNSLGGV